MLIRLLESWLISLCCSFWLKLSSFLIVASSLSDDCSTTRRSRISVLSTYKVENEGAVTFLPPSNRHIKIHVNKSFTFCSLLFRLKALLQLTDSGLQVELFLVPISSLIRQYLHDNSLENRSVKGTKRSLNKIFNLTGYDNIARACEIQPRLCGHTLVIMQISAPRVLRFAATACCSSTPPH